MLRPATDKYPIERELSLGLTTRAAVDELKENHGTAALLVGRIHTLPYGLRTVPNSENGAKADLHGLPLFSTDPVQRDLAVAMATDLAGISYFAPV